MRGVDARAIPHLIVLAFAAAFATWACADLPSELSAPWNDRVAISRTLRIGGASIQLDFGPGTADLAPDRIVAWVTNAAQSVSVYYGRFPVSRDRILVEFDA